MAEQMPSITAEQARRRFDFAPGPGEQLLAAYTRHWIVFARRIWWVVVILGVILVAGWIWLANSRGSERISLEVLLAAVSLLLLLAVLYSYVDWRNDALIMTDQRLIHIEKVVLFFLSQKEVELAKVQNVRASVRGFFPTLLKYGEVHIETAARGSDISFGPMSHPRATQEEIMGRVQAIRAEATTQMIRATLRHRLDPERYPAPVPPEETTGPPLARTRRWLPLLPPNPVVVGSTVTWHKHGYFLFLRLFWPALLLVGLVVVAIRFLVGRPNIGILWLAWALAVLVDIGILVWRYQLWLGDIYVVTADSIHDIYRTPFGLFGESRRSADLGRIQNITFEQPGFLPTLLHYGNVRIQTAGAEDFTFGRIPQPADVQREIYRHQGLYRQREEQRRYGELVDWLAEYHRLQGEAGEE